MAEEDEPDAGSITAWIQALKDGHPRAAEALWRHYFERVVRLARRRLQTVPHQAVEDAEDAALSAFRVLLAGATQGRFLRLRDRVDLWQLLAAITAKKVLSLKQRHSRLKRGGSGQRGAGKAEEVETEGGDDLDPPGHAEGPGWAMSKEPAPDIEVLLEEEVQRLLGALDDETLRKIAVGRLDGLSNAEIAHELCCAVRTVERKLERIRAIWTEAGLGAE
jgi:DNA-directed RNA polymerase specialized sigma24 family protein